MKDNKFKNGDLISLRNPRSWEQARLPGIVIKEPDVGALGVYYRVHWADVGAAWEEHTWLDEHAKLLARAE